MNTAIKFQRSALSGRRQSGAALVVGLVLLMILTLLAISGMNTSTLELQMAGNFQFSQNAFQAAEMGLERAMSGSVFKTNENVAAPQTTITGSSDTYETLISFDCAKNGETNAPRPRAGGGGFSMGEQTGYSAYHFEVESTGRSQRGARAVNVQDFYLVRQEGGCPGF